MKPLESLRSAIATGRGCQTVTVRRGHLRWLLREHDRLTELISDPRCNGDHADCCGVCKTIANGDGRDGGGCDSFVRGKPRGECEGDGHYECRECVEYRSKA